MVAGHPIDEPVVSYFTPKRAHMTTMKLNSAPERFRSIQTQHFGMGTEAFSMRFQREPPCMRYRAKIENGGRGCESSVKGHASFGFSERRSI
jgi:hypothetical protein